MSFWPSFRDPCILTLTYSERIALCRIPVTLDGEPAAICGARLGYARVVVLPNGRACEWTWESAQDIVSRGAAFRSSSPRGAHERDLRGTG